jgi:hypothetical protein
MALFREHAGIKVHQCATPPSKAPGALQRSTKAIAAPPQSFGGRLRARLAISANRLLSLESSPQSGMATPSKRMVYGMDPWPPKGCFTGWIRWHPVYGPIRSIPGVPSVFLASIANRQSRKSGILGRTRRWSHPVPRGAWVGLSFARTGGRHLIEECNNGRSIADSDDGGRHAEGPR